MKIIPAFETPDRQRRAAVANKVETARREPDPMDAMADELERELSKSA